MSEDRRLIEHSKYVDMNAVVLDHISRVVYLSSKDLRQYDNRSILKNALSALEDLVYDGINEDKEYIRDIKHIKNGKIESVNDEIEKTRKWRRTLFLAINRSIKYGPPLDIDIDASDD